MDKNEINQTLDIIDLKLESIKYLINSIRTEVK